MASRWFIERSEYEIGAVRRRWAAGERSELGLFSERSEYERGAAGDVRSERSERIRERSEQDGVGKMVAVRR